MSDATRSAPRPQRDDRNAIDKALALLNAFGDDANVGVGVSELARRTGLSKSTAFRILTVLQRNGAVERAGSAYRLGRVVQGGGAERTESPELTRLRDLLTPFLADMYEASRQTVHLAALDGDRVVYLNKLHGHMSMRSPTRIGGTAPAYCTGVGKVLLAWDADATELALAGELAPWTPNTITDADALRTELERVRRTGVAFDREEIVSGLTCIAAPIMGPNETPVAAMSVSGPVGSYAPESQAHALRRVCSSASQQVLRMHRMLEETRQRTLE
ncbi:MAG: IclR family transcriptional regulator [Microbacteriaceae bacterium]|nr:IclR family transcriptional regulator [Microbacteriaceae bacterium]